MALLIHVAVMVVVVVFIWLPVRELIRESLGPGVVSVLLELGVLFALVLAVVSMMRLVWPKAFQRPDGRQGREG